MFGKSGLQTFGWNSNLQQLHAIDNITTSMSIHVFKDLQCINEKKKQLAVNSTFSYIDDALSINKCYFHSYVDSIYPSESEIKDTTQSASYLNIYLKKNTSIITLQSITLYDNRDDRQFSLFM